MFRDANVFKEQNLLSAVAKLTEDVVLTATVPPQLLFNTKGMTVEQVVEKMINFLLITQKSWNFPREKQKNDKKENI